MATVEFKFAVGDKVYTVDGLRPEMACKARCYTVDMVLRGEGGNKYSLSNAATMIPEDMLVAVDQAKGFAIERCASLIQQIAMRDFEK